MSTYSPSPEPPPNSLEYKGTLIEPLTHDLYIGRLLLGTSEIVSQLEKDFNIQQIVQDDGQFVLPYTYRRQLSFTANPLALASTALANVFREPVYAERVKIETVGVYAQRREDMHAVRIEFSTLNKNLIQKEMKRARGSFEMTGSPSVRDIARHQPVNIRAFETTNLWAAEAASEVIDVLIGREMELSLPRICQAPKK